MKLAMSVSDDMFNAPYLNLLGLHYLSIDQLLLPKKVKLGYG